MSDTRFSDEQFGRVEAICAEHRDRPWATKDSMERELMSVAVVNMPNMIAEIRHQRAENKELRASYERVEKYAAELRRQREKQADMIRTIDPLYR